MRLDVDIALTHLSGRKRQTLVSVFGVATGVGFSIAMAALMQGSQRNFITQIIDTMPHVTVKDEYRNPPPQPVLVTYRGGAVSLRGFKPKEELRGIRRAKRMVSRLQRLPGVAAAPTLRGQVVMSYGGKDVAAALVGIEPELERGVSQIESDMRVGDLEALYGAANGIVIGSGAARKLGAEPGATLSVSSPAGVLRKMKVVGIFHTGVTGVDNGEAYALLKKVQILQQRPNVVNEIRLRLEDVSEARPLARRIEAQVGYRTESWDEANEGILEVFFIRNAIMYTVVGAILLVAGFGIFNVISTVTYEKARDIAILRSIGFQEWDIRLIFVLEGLATGVTGSLLGWLLGYGLCRLLGMIRFELQMEGFPEMTQLPLYYTPVHYLIAATCALVASAVAGYLPARKAASLNPVDIIRGTA